MIVWQRQDRGKRSAENRGGIRLKPAAFAYAKARSLDHALELLGHDGARVLAGGQSLIATLNMRLGSATLLVDINDIEGLDGIAVKDGALEIGALVRHAQAERSDLVAGHAPLIARALPHIGHPAIRNRGTVGGSIALADPAAELPACVVALGGEMVVAGPLGRRHIAAEDFFTGLYETALGPRDILVAIRVPLATPERVVGFAELARRHGDYAMVGLAAAARAEGVALRDACLVFFGIGVRPVRARGAENVFAAGNIEAAVAALAGDLDPPDDLQASGAVKHHLAGVLLRRVAAELLEHFPEKWTPVFR
jgi:carbon-monoxide dehydrogenase medium subunit